MLGIFLSVLAFIVVLLFITLVFVVVRTHLFQHGQRANVRVAAQVLAPLIREHQLVLVHGNGTQVGIYRRRQSRKGKRS